MKETLAVDSLRDPKVTETITGVLPMAAGTAFQEGAEQEFERILADALEQESVSASPVKYEREKLASSVSASAAMPKLQERFDIYQQNLGEVYHLEQILALDKVEKLRDAVAEGFVTPEKAVEKLKQAINEFHQNLAAGTSVNLFLSGKGINVPVEKQSEEDMLAQLREAASHLKETALKNISVDSALAGQTADVWVQQVWPLNEANSIFNKFGGRDVPYNPNRGKPEISFADREVQEWDESFETEWINAQTVQAVPNSAPQSEQPVFEKSLGDASASVDPAVSSVPNGDKLFREMVSLLQTNLEKGNQRMNLELHPENLGMIKLKLSLQGDKFSARFLVEDGSVRDSLAGRMDELKAALSAKGIETNDISIALKKNGIPVVEDILSDSASRREFRNNAHYAAISADYSHSTSKDGSNTWVV